MYAAKAHVDCPPRMSDYEPTKPAFGHAILGEWMLDESISYLNHGSYGAAPRRVLAVQQRWRDALESDPARFVRDELPDAMQAARHALSKYLRADPNNLAYVDNATSGVNAVVSSLDIASGEEIVTTSHAYSAVRKTLDYHCARRGARVVEVPLGFPLPADDDVLTALDSSLSERTSLVVVDHVTSDSASLLPLEQVADLCRQRGIKLLIDGAHAPGMLALDLERLGVDWYAGNTHKWLCAPKGAGFLWARADRKADIHPPVISRNFGNGFSAEFDWQGTRDFSAWLSLPEVMAFREYLGDARARAYNSNLVHSAADMLATAWKTETGNPPLKLCSMATIRLPARVPPSASAIATVRRFLLHHHGIEAHFVALEGAVWARISSHVYNEMSDYEQLAEKIPVVLERMPWLGED